MKTASVRGRRRALAIAIAVCSGLGAAGAWGEEIEVEEVVVTGSRIKSASVYAPQPISTITSETITQSGQVDITEVLNDNPALLSSVSSSNSIDATAANIGDVGAIGGASLNLRGLGIERTLTVVNGRRHVAGFEGTSAVDVGSIPGRLSIGGSAHRWFVCNLWRGRRYRSGEFHPQRRFRRRSVRLPAWYVRRDGQRVLQPLGGFGRNFADGKGNVTVAVQYDYDDGLKQGDRNFFREDGVWNNDTNPTLRFQTGDIDAGATPNFSRYYNFDNTGLFPVGLRIPTAAEDFVADYTGEFGEAPTLTAGELAIIERGIRAPLRPFSRAEPSVSLRPTAWLPSGTSGRRFPLGSEPDLDGNGTSDCLQSFTGYNSSLDGAGSFGAAGGCWLLTRTAL